MIACCIFRDVPEHSDGYITDQRWLNSQRCSAQQEAQGEGEQCSRQANPQLCFNSMFVFWSVISYARVQERSLSDAAV